MGDKLGRLHMERQNLDKMKSRRATALRGERHSKSAEAGDQKTAAVESGNANATKKRRLSSSSA